MNIQIDMIQSYECEYYKLWYTPMFSAGFQAYVNLCFAVMAKSTKILNILVKTTAGKQDNSVSHKESNHRAVIFTVPVQTPHYSIYKEDVMTEFDIRKYLNVYCDSVRDVAIHIIEDKCKKGYASYYAQTNICPISTKNIHPYYNIASGDMVKHNIRQANVQSFFSKMVCNIGIDKTIAFITSLYGERPVVMMSHEQFVVYLRGKQEINQNSKDIIVPMFNIVDWSENETNNEDIYICNNKKLFDAFHDIIETEYAKECVQCL